MQVENCSVYKNLSGKTIMRVQLRLDLAVIKDGCRVPKRTLVAAHAFLRLEGILLPHRCSTGLGSNIGSCYNRLLSLTEVSICPCFVL
jgi:hypothetical protein